MLDRFRVFPAGALGVPAASVITSEKAGEGEAGLRAVIGVLEASGGPGLLERAFT